MLRFLRSKSNNYLFIIKQRKLNIKAIIVIFFQINFNFKKKTKKQEDSQNEILYAEIFK